MKRRIKYYVKILLIGEVYSSNLGDGIICETAYSLIKNQFLDIEIDFFDLTFRNNFLEYRNFNLSINEKNIKQIICDILLSNSIGEFILKYKEVHSNKDKLGILYKNKYDLYVFVGGSLVSDSQRFLTMADLGMVLGESSSAEKYNNTSIAKMWNVMVGKTLVECAQPLVRGTVGKKSKPLRKYKRIGR